MGGVSASGFEIDPSGGENGGPAGIFRGSLPNNIKDLNIFTSFTASDVFHSFLSIKLLPSSGFVSTANNGGFASIRTKVIYGFIRLCRPFLVLHRCKICYIFPQC